MKWLFESPVLFFGIIVVGGMVSMGLAVAAVLDERKRQRELAAYLSRK